MEVLHINANCERKLIELDDAVCAFERGSGREYTLILVPHQPDEKIVMSQNGKPLPSLEPYGLSPEDVLDLAMGARRLIQAKRALEQTKELLDEVD